MKLISIILCPTNRPGESEKPVKLGVEARASDFAAEVYFGVIDSGVVAATVRSIFLSFIISGII